MDTLLVRCTIRLNRVLFAKFRYVAGYDGRSANKEIEHLMKKRVSEYEAKHGRIVLPNDIRAEDE